MYHNTLLLTGNGMFKFSYVVSAPLHRAGFFEFWGNKNLGMCDKIAVVADLFLHLCFWLVPFALEFWMATQSNHGSDTNQELQMGSFWCLVVAFVGLAIAQVFGFMNQEAGKLYASTYALIVGGGFASIIFNILHFTNGGDWLHTNTSADDAATTFRFMVYWCIALKILAVITVQQNARFWGHCKSVSVRDSAASDNDGQAGGLSVKVGA